jgi:nucleotide-binding universal stress UspA family protein
MRSIAVPVADRDECAIALDVAFSLGKHVGADVVGYHMRPSKKSAQQNRLVISAIWGDRVWPEEDEDKAGKKALAAQKLFNATAARHGFELSRKHGDGLKLRGLWREKLGTPDKLMPLVGPVNDLLVVSRPQFSRTGKTWLIMMAALLDSGIPVLLLPQEKVEVPCQHIAVAWNRGPQEAQAVHASLALLQRASKVTLVAIGKDYRHGPSAREMIDYLGCHGIRADEVRAECGVPGKEGATLVQAAKKAGADVLLGGAYTKGRLREMFFGGVTEHLVWGTDFPVILKHS